MSERVDRVTAAHEEILELAKRLKLKGLLDKARTALYRSGSPTRQRLDGTRPGRGRSGSSAIPASDPLARRIEAAERALVEGVANAQRALRSVARAAECLDELCDDQPYYADGARQCPGYQQIPHKTTERFVLGYCKSCDDRRRYTDRTAKASDRV